MKFKIKRNDTVKVIAGKEKGKTGKVRKVLRDDKKLIIEGINMVTKHVKATADGPGRKFRKESPVNISNVSLWNTEEERTVKVGFVSSVDDSGKKTIVRVDKKTQMPIDK